MNISKKDLDELLSAGIITPETRQAIADYHNSKIPDNSNRIFVVFGIIGALLIGLGIILILAHNWDDFPKSVRTFLAFLPLVLSQLLCGFSFFFRKDSVGWRESSTTLLVFSIGSSIALVAQIYNIPGDFKSFVTTWVLLSVPLVYLMRSSMASLLSIAGATVLTFSIGFGYPRELPFEYFGFVVLLAPHYLMSLKNRPDSNFTAFHHWFWGISTLIAIGAFGIEGEEFTMLSYVFLLAILYQIGEFPMFSGKALFANPFRVLSAVGIPILLLIASFEWFWMWQLGRFFEPKLFSTANFWIAFVLFVGCVLLLIRKYKTANPGDLDPIPLFSLVFVAAFIIGYFTRFAVILPNILVLCIGLWYVEKGRKMDHLGLLNFGLLIIVILAICRFFDTDIPFVARGLLFMAVGTGFILTNVKLLKNRRKNEQ
ncbi:DUF2157 domain-containing protein [Flavobacterium sp.]|uniref:DUF2157 domain-containing protein n=1 Tax=Flavobacterium sp. TaxID=239 RepID=UPI00122BCFAA|nr:DUF2157 domain-containing protein [Flavobacterium sp.]RZJ70692.1 MAG: DUF2157 domain-containing protein [Flavobacterium sp.]